jgi:hypothetical protein
MPLADAQVPAQKADGVIGERDDARLPVLRLGDEEPRGLDHHVGALDGGDLGAAHPGGPQHAEDRCVPPTDERRPAGVQQRLVLGLGHDRNGARLGPVDLR